MLAEVLERHRDKNRPRLNSQRSRSSIRAGQVSNGPRVDLAASNGVALGVDKECRADGNRLSVVGLEMDRDHRNAKQPRDGAQGLVEGSCQKPSVSETGSTLVMLSHLQFSVDRAALPCRQGQVQTGRMIGTAPEALSVVTAE